MYCIPQIYPSISLPSASALDGMDWETNYIRDLSVYAVSREPLCARYPRGLFMYLFRIGFPPLPNISTPIDERRSPLAGCMILWWQKDVGFFALI